MIEVTFQFKTVDEAIVALGKLASVGSVQKRVSGPTIEPAAQPGSPPTPTEDQPKRGRGRPRKKAAPSPAVAAETTGAESPVAKGETVAAPSAPALPAAPEPAASPVAGAGADPQGALEKVFNKHGMQSAQAVLLKFGVNRLRDLKAEDRPAFVEACEKAL